MRRGEGRLCILLVAPGVSGALAVLSHNAPSVIFPYGADGLLRAVHVRAVKPSALLSGGIQCGLFWAFDRKTIRTNNERGNQPS